MPALVSSYDEVVENVRRFNRDLDSQAEIADRLSYFRHWYYIPELNQFGPSKFIGYAEMDASTYERSAEKDGRETEHHLQQWFAVLDPEDDRFSKLLRMVEARLDEFRKEPNRMLRIHVPKGMAGLDEQRGLSRLLDRFESLLDRWEEQSRRVDALLDRLDASRR